MSGYNNSLIAHYMINTITRSPLWKKGFISNAGKSGQALKAGTWRQELKQRPWRSTDYWLAPHGLLSLLSYSYQDHQPRRMDK